QGSSIPDGQQTQRLYTSLSFLHEHYSQPLSISALAAMETLSVSRYRMLFHEIFGISPITYLTRLRMRQALTLLLQTNLPISHISSSVGYEDPLYFSRAFRRMFGLSPTDYRNLHTHK
ncbi:MAG: helix-turn-helix transcriptional regulator, partial [Clostridia bacterium]|nr:helix-turn-helix transcriptional regulator [Clostridia bacterium]